jgi:hypothetical protein
MNLKIHQEVKDICMNILKKQIAAHQWTLIESSDMFQANHYCGGYDATEHAFCFSYYDVSRNEF